MRISELCFNLIKKIKNFFYYERVVLYGYDLRVNHDFEARIPDNMKLLSATVKDVEELYYDDLNTGINSIEWNIWEEKISKGLWKGFICKDGDALVAQAFHSMEDIFFGGTKWVVLNLPPDSAYGFKFYTRPDYRGKKLGQAITSFRLNNAQKEGIKNFYTIILHDNKVARHNEEKIGGYPIGSVIFLKCRFFNKVFLTPGLLRAGFRIKKITDRGFMD